MNETLGPPPEDMDESLEKDEIDLTNDSEFIAEIQDIGYIFAVKRNPQNEGDEPIFEHQKSWRIESITDEEVTIIDPERNIKKIITPKRFIDWQNEWSQNNENDKAIMPGTLHSLLFSRVMKKFRINQEKNQKISETNQET